MGKGQSKAHGVHRVQEINEMKYICFPGGVGESAASFEASFSSERATRKSGRLVHRDFVKFSRMLPLLPWENCFFQLPSEEP